MLLGRGALFGCVILKFFLPCRWVDYGFGNGTVLFSDNAVHFDSVFVSLNNKKERRSFWASCLMERKTLMIEVIFFSVHILKNVITK